MPDSDFKLTHYARYAASFEAHAATGPVKPREFGGLPVIVRRRRGGCSNAKRRNDQADLLDASVEYPSKSFKPVATLAWLAFFKHTSPECELAFWEIEADSATVKLSARSADIDEDGSNWEPPTPFVALVDGIVECFATQPKSQFSKLRSSFYEWVSAGILASFCPAQLPRCFAESSPDATLASSPPCMTMGWPTAHLICFGPALAP